MEGQRGKGRAKGAFKSAGQGINWTVPEELDHVLEQTGDQFEGYAATCVPGATMVGLFDETGTPGDRLDADRDA